MLRCYCFLVSKTCTGWSCDICSWKIQEDIAKVPFAGHQFYIHTPCNCHCTFILRVPLGDQQFLKAFSTIFPYLQFYRHGWDHEGDWIIIDYAIEWKLFTWIEHAAVFKDKVYVVTGDARIGILNLLDSQPRVRMLKVHGVDQAPGCLFLDSLNLVASDKQYFFMVLYMKRHLLIRFYCTNSQKTAGLLRFYPRVCGIRTVWSV